MAPDSTIGGLRVALEPRGEAAWLAEAVEAGGGTVAGLDDADALVWTAGGDASGLAAVLDAHPRVRWVQLPFAGIENLVHLVDDRVWTCGKGAYADPVAEMALSLALSGMRSVATYARARSWAPPTGQSLLGAKVAIIGGGGIATSLLRLLQPFGCDVTVVRNRVAPMDGARRVLSAPGLAEAITGTDLVVIAVPLTAATTGLIGAAELALMGPTCWLVNVGRGQHVVTTDLVAALADGAIAGAALDVVDPEPLPDGHPLWDLPNCIVAPHSGNIASISARLLGERVRANVQRRIAGEDLLGVVDPAAGY